MNNQNTEIESWTLSNSAGMRAKIIAIGGIVSELHVPDRDGKLSDVVLGFSKPSDYLNEHPFFGAITGRVAGRLTHGKFTLEGKAYEMEINNAPNHLHGGSNALDKKIWALKSKTENNGHLTSISLNYLSPDGEEGYPGNLDITVTYSVTEDNALVIDYHATTDKATPISLTNHSYFNLSGENSGDIQKHQLQIHTEHYVPADEDMTLQNTLKSVDGSANDFRTAQTLEDRIPHLHKEHGDNYVFGQFRDSEVKPIAKLHDPASGRTMEVLSTEPHLQFYTGKFLETTLIGKSGQAYGPFSGLCLECQNYPDGANAPELGNTILQVGETYEQKTIYRFSND